MSIRAVNKFWEKVSSDSNLQKAFVRDTQARIVSFAAANNFQFTEAELQTVADEFKAKSDKLRADLNALREKDLAGVVGGLTATTANATMTTMDTGAIFNRLGEMMDVINKTSG